MKGFFRLALLPALLLLSIHCNRAVAQEAVRPPAQYKSEGVFSGGAHDGHLVVSGIRFGAQDEGRATRMVLDLEACDSSMGNRSPAPAHPAYSVELRAYPYRLIIHMENTFFDPQAKIGSSPALPFSVVAEEAGTVKEMQVFLPGPCEFKVIEIDDPAKLSIDVRPLRNLRAPDIYTVQLTEVSTPEQAFALVESGQLPAEYQPSVLVLGRVVVVEQVFADPAQAAQVESILRAMGYPAVINERRGHELPQP